MNGLNSYIVLHIFILLLSISLIIKVYFNLNVPEAMEGFFGIFLLMKSDHKVRNNIHKLLNGLIVL